MFSEQCYAPTLLEFKPQSLSRWCLAQLMSEALKTSLSVRKPQTQGCFFVDHIDSSSLGSHGKFISHY